MNDKSISEDDYVNDEDLILYHQIVTAGPFASCSNRRSSDGESSSASAVAAAADDSRDSHHKRAKIYNDPE